VHLQLTPINYAQKILFSTLGGAPAPIAAPLGYAYEGPQNSKVTLYFTMLLKLHQSHSTATSAQQCTKWNRMRMNRTGQFRLKSILNKSINRLNFQVTFVQAALNIVKL